MHGPIYSYLVVEY